MFNALLRDLQASGVHGRDVPPGMMRLARWRNRALQTARTSQVAASNSGGGKGLILLVTKFRAELTDDPEEDGAGEPVLSMYNTGRPIATEGVRAMDQPTPMLMV